MSNEMAIDLYLSLKYKGVKTPWEIMRNPVQYGWSCRKWIRHQRDNKAKENLKIFATALIDDAEIIKQYLPTINVIAERVQRWRKDSDSFELEPDERPEYKDLRRIIAIAYENPEVIRRILMDEFNLVGLESIALSELPMLLKQATGARFIYKMAGQVSPSSMTPIQLSTHWKDACSLLVNAYGLSQKYINDEESANFFLDDLGLNPDIPTPLGLGEDEKLNYFDDVILESYKGPKSKLCKLEFRKGQVFVSINQSHPWVDLLKENSKARDLLFLSIGESYLTQFVSREEVEDFVSELGLNICKRIG